MQKFNRERSKAALSGPELSLNTFEDLPVLRSWQKEEGVVACYFIFPQLTSSQLVLFPNLHWCAEGLMFTFSKLRQRRKKSCFQVFTCRFSRFSYSPSHGASWFLLAVVSHSALTHSTKMSDALNYPTSPPSLGLKHATYCWKF